MKIAFVVCLSMAVSCGYLMAQDNRLVRIAKIKIDPAYLEQYQAAVKEQIEAAIRIEPGVVTLFAVHDKKDAANVTVFEIYTDMAAYQSHIQTDHFKKYKTTTAKMVKSLELIDVTPIAMESKNKL